MKTFKKIILDDLKARGLIGLAKKIKSIRYETFSMGDAVRITAYDMTESQRGKLTEFVDRYKKTDFNSMDDSTTFRKERADVERRTHFITINFEYSIELKAKVAADLAAEGVIDDPSALKKYDLDFFVIQRRKLLAVQGA